jgi:hypothetical protein
MNIVTTSSAWPSLGTSANAGATASPATDASAAAVAAPTTTAVQSHHHRHHEHHDEGDEHSGHHDQQAYMALQIKVEQTFTALTSSATSASATDPNASATTPAATGDEGEDGGSFAATLKAKFSLSQGGMSASLSIRMSSEGQAGSGDLAAQMQGFVQTLYAALHTLFGGSAANPNATLGTPVDTGAAAALAGSTASAPTATGATASTAPASATPDAAESSTAPATDASATTAAAAAPAASTPANASGALSIKLRLTYNSFGSQLGPLTQQLAQPGAAQAAPGMANLLGDLSAQFAQMLSASPAGSGSGLSLGAFLNALAQSFAPAAPAATQPGGPTPAAAPEASAPATTPATASDSPAPASTPAASAYGQVLSFSASVRSQWQLAA